ncbi:Enhancer of polycomb-like transcription factor protein [Perilla frutescens var. frutescens]|nr:Enhancer of polycomb-like transcription factor protein [Perilla frutescens var. frutescens]
MTRLSFRPRPLDINKKLPIVKSVKEFEDDDVPTSTRNSQILRLAAEADNEVQQVSAKKVASEIPTPEFVVVDTYERDYSRTFNQPMSYLRARGARAEIGEFVEYDLDNEDEDWLQEFSNERKILVAEKLEIIIFKLEVLDHRARERAGVIAPTLSSPIPVLLTFDAAVEALQALSIEYGVFRAIYSYWKEKRERWQKPILRRLQPPPPSNDTNPYNVFRPREKAHKLHTRRMQRRENNVQSFEKLRQVRRNLDQAKTILEALIKREEKKRELVGSEITLQRIQMKYKHETELLEDSLAIPGLPSFPSKVGSSEEEFFDSDDVANSRPPSRSPVVQNPHITEPKMVMVPAINMRREAGRRGSHVRLPKLDPNEPVMLFTKPLHQEKLGVAGIIPPPDLSTANGAPARSLNFRGRIGRGGRIVFDRWNPLMHTPIDCASFCHSTLPPLLRYKYSCHFHQCLSIIIMSGGEESGRSFEYTPTWVVAVVCFIIVFISVLAERALHKLGRFFKHKKQDPLFESLQKLKEELMLLGFISLLLTAFQGLISNICMPEHLSNTMLPCKLKTPPHSQTDANFVFTNQRRLLAEEESSSKCPKGHIQFLSLEALHQLHIFIFVMAVVYVVFCATTMVLGGFKIREWRHWEHSIRNEVTKHHRVHGHTRVQLEDFLQRAGKYWRKFTIVSWVVAFFKQFYGSVTKSDYTALRSGFIREHWPNNKRFDFYKYLLRTLEKDFKKIIGISWYLWLFVVIFLLLNIAGWHAYFWMSFLPLTLLLIVGAKLEHIITELATEAAKTAEGTVRPSDELFWFGSPDLVLYLLHFILFQNSFEIAFFLWIWTTYGFNSCIMEGLDFIIPRLVIGVIVQVLCSYSTLPLYALVSQMGSKFKQTVFNDFQKGLIDLWVDSSSAGGGSAENRSESRLTVDMTNPVCLAQQPVVDRSSRATEIELPRSHHPRMQFP